MLVAQLILISRGGEGGREEEGGVLSSVICYSSPCHTTCLYLCSKLFVAIKLLCSVFKLYEEVTDNSWQMLSVKSLISTRYTNQFRLHCSLLYCVLVSV